MSKKKICAYMCVDNFHSCIKIQKKKNAITSPKCELTLKNECKVKDNIKKQLCDGTLKKKSKTKCLIPLRLDENLDIENLEENLVKIEEILVDGLEMPDKSGTGSVNDIYLKKINERCAEENSEIILRQTTEVYNVSKIKKVLNIETKLSIFFNEHKIGPEIYGVAVLLRYQSSGNWYQYITIQQRLLSLEKYLIGISNEELSAKKSTIKSGITRQLNKMLDLGYLHTDIKLDNILINLNNSQYIKIYITDFDSNFTLRREIDKVTKKYYLDYMKIQIEAEAFEFHREKSLFLKEINDIYSNKEYFMDLCKFIYKDYNICKMIAHYFLNTFEYKYNGIKSGIIPIPLINTFFNDVDDFYLNNLLDLSYVPNDNTEGYYGFGVIDYDDYYPTPDSNKKKRGIFLFISFIVCISNEVPRYYDVVNKKYIDEILNLFKQVI